MRLTVTAALAGTILGGVIASSAASGSAPSASLGARRAGVPRLRAWGDGARRAGHLPLRRRHDRHREARARRPRLPATRPGHAPLPGCRDGAGRAPRGEGLQLLVHPLRQPAARGQRDGSAQQERSPGLGGVRHPRGAQELVGRPPDLHRPGPRLHVRAHQHRPAAALPAHRQGRQRRREVRPGGGAGVRRDRHLRVHPQLHRRRWREIRRRSWPPTPTPASCWRSRSRRTTRVRTPAPCYSRSAGPTCVRWAGWRRA